MKSKLLIICTTSTLICGGTAYTQATTLAEGNLTLFAPSSANIRYNYSQNYFGHIIDFNTVDHSFTETRGYLDQPGYTGTASRNGSTMTGDWNEDGSAYFSLSATSPSPSIQSTTWVNFNTRVHFTGILEDFGYDTHYTGSKGSHPDDLLGFVTQMSISYIPEGGNYSDSVFVYSDYGQNDLVDPENNFRNNWVFHYDVENGTYDDSIRFDYSQYGEQNWNIDFDFMATGRDRTNTDPVPEPATILLFGTGLVGLAGSTIRKKKQQ